jgi:hypothetical protein
MKDRVLVSSLVSGAVALLIQGHATRHIPDTSAQAGRE